ncbi:MAG TPA: peptide chain release factor N(5)-glutamine methyltransferase [Chitinophagales bacterium]|nr:peptide chain release factor N(5)-glutamine methyltransferase [Chitinophagales bacterium]
MTLGDFITFAKHKLKHNYERRERDNVIQLLIEETLFIPKHQIKIHYPETLKENVRACLVQAADLLAKDEPVQYVLGFADFYGMRLKVNRHVLIPRPETEELVNSVIEVLMPFTRRKTLSILDIGTGSGCIAIALKKHLADARITAIDTRDESILVASENAMLQKCDVNFRVVDFLAQKTWKLLGRFDVVVSNPPYVTKDEFTEMIPRVRDFEPRHALIAFSDDPFIFYRKIAEFGKNHLSAGGYIFLELNSTHAREIAALFKKDYRRTIVRKDLHGKERILEVQKE